MRVNEEKKNGRLGYHDPDGQPTKGKGMKPFSKSHKQSATGRQACQGEKAKMHNQLTPIFAKNLNRFLEKHAVSGQALYKAMCDIAIDCKKPRPAKYTFRKMLEGDGAVTDFTRRLLIEALARLTGEEITWIRLAEDITWMRIDGEAETQKAKPAGKQAEPIVCKTQSNPPARIQPIYEDGGHVSLLGEVARFFLHLCKPESQARIITIHTNNRGPRRAA